MSAPLLSVSGLRLERGGRVLLEDFDLEVTPGELILIEGANGAGKTTLLRGLAGLSRLGLEGGVERHCERLLFLGHKPGIKQLLTARENLNWFCAAQGISAGRVESALERVGLRGREDLPCRHMSAGQQRRVGLARLYLSDAPLWLLDEPFTAIDREGIRALTETLVRRVGSGVSVVMTSHHDPSLDFPSRRINL